jgi:hypothetical protein
MNRREKWLKRMAAVVQEYLAGQTAAAWLDSQTQANPSFGWHHGWEPAGGGAFCDNLEATYIIRLYAEFEAGIRDYWESYRGKDSRPDMITLLRHAVPTEAFSQDCIDDADDVRLYRNFLVHEMGKDPTPGSATFTLKEAKRHLSEYFSRINPRWK